MLANQSWNPEKYERNAGFVADLGQPVLELLNPQPGERILDLGCGHGKLTEKLVALGTEVVGIDSSQEQVEGACERGLDARVMNAAEMNFSHEFDAVFSNAALHWMKDADLVIERVANALKPTGRFVGEMGGKGNVQRIGTVLEQALAKRGLDIADCWPWYFPSPEEYAGKLKARGFQVEHIELFKRPTPIPGDIEGWLQTFCESFLAAVAAKERAGFIDDVRDGLSAELQDADGNWSVDYVRLRFQARLG